jgi:hypothetical protein
MPAVSFARGKSDGCLAPGGIVCACASGTAANGSINAITHARIVAAMRARRAEAVELNGDTKARNNRFTTMLLSRQTLCRKAGGPAHVTRCAGTKQKGRRLAAICPSTP